MIGLVILDSMNALLGAVVGIVVICFVNALFVVALDVSLTEGRQG
jgi:hypothetical protein